jgi:hypothetical protein
MFEPDPSWYERLPSAPAASRLEREELAPWPDITPGERIGLGWSLLVSDREEEVWERARGVPRFRWPAVGLLSPEVDLGISGDDLPFGVILYAEASPNEGEQRLPGLAFDDVELPVVVRYGHYQEHGPVPLIPHGRLACRATTRNGRFQGWVTARHVAEHPLMATVGTVLDSAPECLDAALVDIGTSWGGVPQSLATPANGGTVELEFSAIQRATILDVATNLGVQYSSRFPLRFSFNAAGQHGDSGSLITAIPCGEPLGIYLGAFTSRTGARTGVGLAFSQLAVLIDLEVYA